MDAPLPFPPPPPPFSRIWSVVLSCTRPPFATPALAKRLLGCPGGDAPRACTVISSGRDDDMIRFSSSGAVGGEFRHLNVRRISVGGPGGVFRDLNLMRMSIHDCR